MHYIETYSRVMPSSASFSDTLLPELLPFAIWVLACERVNKERLNGPIVICTR